MSNDTDSFVMDRFIDEAMVIISDKLSLSKRKKRLFRRNLKSTLSENVYSDIIPSLGRSIMVSLFDNGVDDTDIDSVIESTKDICKQFVIENIHTILIGIAEDADGHDPESRRSLELSVHDVYKTLEPRVSKLSFDDDEVTEELIDICAVFSELKGFDMNMFEEFVGIHLANALKGDIDADWETETESETEWESDEDVDMPLIESDDGDICTIGDDNLFGRRYHEYHNIQNVMEEYNDKLQNLIEEFKELKGEINSYIKRDEEASSTIAFVGWMFIIYYFCPFFNNTDPDSPRGLEMHPF